MPRKGQFQEYCKRGHLRTEDNLYLPKRMCKTCALIRNEAKVARILAKQKANPKAHAKRNREWAATESGRRSVRNTQLKKNYGISLEEYEDKLQKQDGKCAICFVVMDSSYKGLVPCVDHVHDEEKKLRDLLCGSCNMFIGQARENTEVLLSAIEYLRKHADKKAATAAL